MLENKQVIFLIFENCHTVSYSLCTNLYTNLTWQTVCKCSLLPTSLSGLVIFSLFSNSHSYMVRQCVTRLCCRSLRAFVFLLLGNVYICLPILLQMVYFIVIEPSEILIHSRRWYAKWNKSERKTSIWACSYAQSKNVGLRNGMTAMRNWNDQKERKDEDWLMNASLQLDKRKKMLIPLHI